MGAHHISVNLLYDLCVLHNPYLWLHIPQECCKQLLIPFYYFSIAQGAGICKYKHILSRTRRKCSSDNFNIQGSFWIVSACFVLEATQSGYRTQSCSYREEMPLEIELINHSGICEQKLLPCSQPKISQNDKDSIWKENHNHQSYGPKTIYPFSKFIRWGSDEYNCLNT